MARLICLLIVLLSSFIAFPQSDSKINQKEAQELLIKAVNNLHPRNSRYREDPQYRINRAWTAYKELNLPRSEFYKKIESHINEERNRDSQGFVSRSDEFFKDLKKISIDEPIEPEFYNKLFADHANFLDEKIKLGEEKTYYEAHKELALKVGKFTEEEIFDGRMKRTCEQQFGKYDKAAKSCKCGMKLYGKTEECVPVNGIYAPVEKSLVENACQSKPKEETLNAKDDHSRGAMHYNYLEFQDQSGFVINMGVGEFSMHDSLNSYFITQGSKGPVFTDRLGKTYPNITEFVKKMELEPIRVKNFEDGKELNHIYKPRLFKEDMEKYVSQLAEKLKTNAENCSYRSGSNNPAELVEVKEASVCEFNGPYLKTRYVCRCKYITRGEVLTGTCEDKHVNDQKTKKTVKKNRSKALDQ
ncbi:MAG TPA: hypothetical protein VNJ01_12580 [Bacteriovoracaceae bacterium]|nr:hypothetical protein [Bacteriovoracaceae bacterium]